MAGRLLLRLTVVCLGLLGEVLMVLSVDLIFFCKFLVSGNGFWRWRWWFGGRGVIFGGDDGKSMESV